MKEELLRRAVEMAKKCRKYHDEQENKKEKSLEERMETYTCFLQSSWELIGFCRALNEVGIFDEEDIKVIWNSAFPEPEFLWESETGLPAQIMSFIQTLEDIDKLEPD
ncbi:MAG: hypothetical protein WC919_04895 [Candidatus Paceibacterota bacterium]|jgi:hypothetical protein|nr:hypothetical protein [Candidatus Paceibacterota bacterium]